MWVKKSQLINCEVCLRIYTESFICEFLFVSVEILKRKICIYQITDPWVKPVYLKWQLGEFVHNITKPLFRIAWHFWTNTEYSGEVLLIISVDIHLELTQSSNLNIFKLLKTLRFHSLLLLTQGNIYNHLRSLNKYLMFLEVSNELFRENWLKFRTAG